MDKSALKVKILRCDEPDSPQYWEDFIVAVKKNATVQDVLTAIQESPVNAVGNPVAPVAWECNCIEEVCGACAMNICGKPGMACGTLVDSVLKDRDDSLVLAPLSKYPAIRDLVVDRTRIYDTYKKYHVYVSPEAVASKQDIERTKWEDVYPYTRCLSCGCCAEICPNVGGKTSFTGALGMSISRVLSEFRSEDMSGFMEKGGVAGCSGFSMCSGACPKGIDLPAAVAFANRSIQKGFLRKIKARLYNRKG